MRVTWVAEPPGRRYFRRIYFRAHGRRNSKSKWAGQQFTQRELSNAIDQHNRFRIAEFRQHLPARAAGHAMFGRRAWARVGTCDGDHLEAIVPRRDGGEHRHAFRAYRKSKRGVFEVAAGDDFALGQHRRADMKLRIGAIGSLGRARAASSKRAASARIPLGNDSRSGFIGAYLVSASVFFSHAIICSR